MAISEIRCYLAGLEWILAGIALAGDDDTNDLKVAIKARAAPRLNHLAASQLVLYKVKQSIPLLQPWETLNAAVADLFPDGEASHSVLERLSWARISTVFPDPPLKWELHIIVCLPEVDTIDLYRRVNRKIDEPNIIMERLNNFTQQAPSSLANPSTFKTAAQDILCCNRPFDLDTIPITLLQEEFGRFKDDCDVLPSPKSQLLLHSLTMAACNWYNNKSQRRSEIQRIFHEEAGLYLSAQAILDTEYITDGNSTINIMPSVIRACENEYGCALQKAITHYVQFLMKALNTSNIHDRFPCIFLVDVGPYIGFYGSLWTGERLHVEPLTPLYDLTIHWTDESSRRSIAAALDAFLKAIPRLEYHYGDVAALSSFPPERLLLQDRTYPYKTSYEDENGREISFKYRSWAAEKLAFIVKPDDQDLGMLSVRFTKWYSAGAHRLLAGRSHAPQLRAFMPLAGGWNMVVMDFSRYTPLSDPTLVLWDKLRWDVKAKAEKILKILHNEGFVYGNVQKDNVLVNRKTLASEDEMEMHFIDFSWASHVGDAIRPMRLQDDLKFGGHRVVTSDDLRHVGYDGVGELN